MNTNKIKVIFDCRFYSFHKDFCINIKNELEKRGHIAIILEKNDSSTYNNVNFTILPDEACSVIEGSKGIYINHALLPVVPQHSFYYEKKFSNKLYDKVSYMFLPSQEITDLFIHELKINIPYVIVGFPKLDNIFKKRKLNETFSEKIKNNKNLNILYAPTGIWKTTMNSDKIVDTKLLNKFGNIIHIGHPSKDKKNNNLEDNLINVDIIISDYSSVGYDAIALNIPTILIDNDYWDHISFKSKLICEEARNASIRVKTMEELINAINTYKNNPNYLEKERLYYSTRLTKYKENSSEIFVDELIKLV